MSFFLFLLNKLFIIVGIKPGNVKIAHMFSSDTLGLDE